MLIVVCGMHRSGSTLVWQITRQLLGGDARLRNPRGISTSEFPIAAADPSDLLMAKVHFSPALERANFPDEGAKYLYTYRDPRDVVASLYRKGRYKPEDPERGRRNSRIIARRETRGDAFWTSKSDVWIGRYEDFRSDVPGLVRTLAEYLQVAIDDERAISIVSAVNLEAQEERARVAKAVGIDENLRITSNHITDGREGAWRDTLTPEELVAIEAETARWLVEHRYDVTTAIGRRKTTDLRQQPTREPAKAKPAARPRRDRRMPAFLCAAALFAIAGFVVSLTFPVLSPLPWIAAIACAMASAFLWGRSGQRLRPRVARQQSRR